MARRNIIFMNFADSIPFSMSCNFHTGAEVFNYPWDTWSNLTADDSWWQELGAMYADTVHQYSNTNYFNYLNNGVLMDGTGTRLMVEDKIL